MLLVIMAFLSSAWAKIKPILSYLMNLAPLPFGIAIGYIFKPEIKLVIDLVLDLLKL